jgi:hypothetical protein
MGEYEDVGSSSNRRKKSSLLPATKNPLPGREESPLYMRLVAGYRRRERRPKEYAAYAVSK